MRVPIFSWRLGAAIAIATALSFLSGCATTGVITGQSIPENVSTEGKLAIQGRAVVAACDGILSATDAAVTSKLLTPSQALPVAQACRQVGLMGQRLASALRLLDAASTVNEVRQAAGVEAKGLLAQMSDVVTALPAATRSILNDTVGAFSSAVSALRGMLPT